MLWSYFFFFWPHCTLLVHFQTRTPSGFYIGRWNSSLPDTTDFPHYSHSLPLDWKPALPYAIHQDIILRAISTLSRSINRHRDALSGCLPLSRRYRVHSRAPAEGIATTRIRCPQPVRPTHHGGLPPPHTQLEANGSCGEM